MSAEERRGQAAVLVVSESAAFCALLRVILTTVERHRVDVIASLAEAAPALANGEHDVLIVDAPSSADAGRRLAAAINGRSLGLVMLTARGVQLVFSGPFVRLTRPLTARSLRKAVREALSIRQGAALV